MIDRIFIACSVSRARDERASSYRQIEHSFFGRFPTDTARGVGVEIVIEVDDIWAAYERARGVTPAVAAPRLRAWGSRDFRLEDPFGYYLRITD